MPTDLSNHHRGTLEQIFSHPSSANIDWRQVVLLLEAVGTVTHEHNGKLKPPSSVRNAPHSRERDDAATEPETGAQAPDAGCETGAMETPDLVELIRSRDLSGSAPYAYAAVARGFGRLVFTAGACPLDPEGGTVAVGDVTGQAEQVMANLRVALQAAGADLVDVVKTTVYVATQRREDLLAAWDVVSRHFGDHDAPSTLLGVAVLGYPDQLVEVEAIAALR